MPEVIRRHDLSGFPAGGGKGSVYTPLPNDVKDGKLRAHAVQTILVEPQGLYELWRDVKAAPLWMEYVISVEEKGDNLTHWVMGDPEDKDSKRVEFDSEIVADEPGRRLAWKSVTQGVDESGEVTFEPTANGRGTLVTLQEFATLPGGKLSQAMAGLTKRTPKQIVIENLRHFKEMAESGEIPSVEGQPTGPRGVRGKMKAQIYGENNPTPPGTQAQASANQA